MVSADTTKRFNLALARNIIAVGEGLTDSNGVISVDDLSTQGLVICSLSEDPGNDLVFSHVIIQKGQFIVYVKDASAATPISAAVLASKKVFYFILKR